MTSWTVTMTPWKTKPPLKWFPETHYAKKREREQTAWLLSLRPYYELSATTARIKLRTLYCLKTNARKKTHFFPDFPVWRAKDLLVTKPALELSVSVLSHPRDQALWVTPTQRLRPHQALPRPCYSTSLRLVMWTAAWSTFPSHALRPSRASWALNPNCIRLWTFDGSIYSSLKSWHAYGQRKHKDRVNH